MLTLPGFDPFAVNWRLVVGFDLGVCMAPWMLSVLLMICVFLN